MVKKITKYLFIFFFLFSFIMVAGCRNTTNTPSKSDLEKKQEEIYLLAKESGYNGSYEEWLETIKGVDGTSIVKVEINSKGELIITLSNGKVNNLGVVKGTDGVGIDNVKIDENGCLIITYTNGTSKNLGVINNSSDSTDNVSIKNMHIDTTGALIITFSDNTTKNLGIVKGQDGKDGVDGTDGKDGVGINDIYIDASGNLIIKLSDGTTKDLGNFGGIGGEPVEGVVPVYQGMTLESQEVPALYGREKDDHFKDSVNDFLDIITTEKVEYYAQKGEKFNICVHLYNPSSYEILSFTLNNYKYQTYEFKEGSTSTKLIIEVDAGQVSGLKEYTIDAIKYIDGTEIKDAQMDGEKTVKAGVAYDIVPTASVIKEEVKTTSFSSIIEVKDDSKLVDVTNGLHFFVYDGQSIINHQNLALGINNINIDELLMGKTYQYMVVGVYDDYSGVGKQAGTLVEGTFTTLDGYELSSIESTQESIKVNLTNLDESATFEKVELFKNDVLESTKTVETEILFDGLLSNNEYKVVITYKYTKDDVERTGEIVKVVSTKAKTAPTLSINDYQATNTSISYKLIASDIDNVKVSFTAYLYKGQANVAQCNDLEGIFENLLSNTNYKVVYIYEYDLNDGAGVLKLELESEIKTIAKEEPIIDIAYSKQSETLKYVTTKTDKDNVISSVVYKLYQGSVLVDQTTNEEHLFENLSSNTLYKLEITYKYDLNDGLGEQTKVKSYDVTLSKEVPSIELTSYFVTQTEMEYNVLIKDANAVGRVNMIALYVDNTFLKRLDETTTKIDSLSPNTTYNIRVNYVYDLDDGNGSKEINYTYTFTTLKVEPTYSLALSSVTQRSIDFMYNLNDPNGALTFNKLELMLNGKVVKTYTEITDTLFEELLSDNEYQAVATFTKNLNNGDSTVTTSLSARTVALQKPDVNIKLDSTRTEISYNYVITDSDKVGTFKSIDLYYNGVKQENTPVDSLYSNLYTNSTYEVVVTLVNNYNNGQAAVEETYTQTIKTKAYAEPSVSVELTSTADTMNYEFIYNDPFNLLKVNKLSLYKAGVLAKEITDFSSDTITELLSNTVYEVVIDYQYDLNDNLGVIHSRTSIDYSTLAYDVKVVDYVMMNETQPKTDELINIKVNLENESKVKMDYLIVNGERVDIAGGDYYNYVIFAITAPNMSGDFKITVDKMGYFINNIEVEQKVENVIDININVLSRLNIISYSTPNGSSIWNENYYNGIIFTIDNPYGYTITHLTYNSYSIYDDEDIPVIMIDNNHFYCDIEMRTTIQIKGFKYINDQGEQSERLYNDYLVFDGLALEGDSGTNALVVHQISTPEELLNIKENYSYELTCDIDMSGYIWEPIAFRGVFDGKGHKISNLTIIEENEYSGTSVGIFTSPGFVFQNVYLENIYFSVESQSVYTNIISSFGGVGAPFVKNVLFSGDIHFITTSSAVVDTSFYENCYIVDHLNFNDNAYTEMEVISYEQYNSTDFRENTLGWNFKEKEFANYNGFLYTIIDNSYIIINGYDGEEGVVVIPEEIDGMRVIGIEDLAFEDNTTITSITFPETLLYVGPALLKGCGNLEEIIIKDARIIKSEYILYTLFGNVEYDNSYLNVSNKSSSDFVGNNSYVPSGLTKMYIKSNEEFSSSKVQSLAFDTLKDLTIGVIGTLRVNATSAFLNLEKVTILEGLTEIRNAFRGCNKISSVTLPNTLTTIGDRAFVNCKSLTSITIGDSVTTIGDSAFSGCSSLTSITIPDSVTTIGDSAFNSCTSLTSITIPDSVTTIGDSAFYLCSSLTSITIPDSVTTIEGYAFYSCSSLTSITIPDSVTTIGEEAFYSCSSLTSIIIPDSVTTIGDQAFSSCSSLTSITIGDSVTTIGRNAFAYCTSLTSITIPDSVTSIGDYAFQSCTKLTSITIPDSVTTIGDSAFYLCSSLTSITIGDSVTTIGDYAFCSCSSLTSITIPDSVTTIGDDAFYYCSNLTIYCEAKSLPSGWSNTWNPENRPVIWGYSE